MNLLLIENMGKDKWRYTSKEIDRKGNIYDRGSFLLVDTVIINHGLIDDLRKIPKATIDRLASTTDKLKCSSVSGELTFTYIGE